QQLAELARELIEVSQFKLPRFPAMADSSMVTLGTARSLLVDTSVYDSRIVETTKDQAFLSMACEDGEDMLPKVETRVVLVGEAGTNGALVNALQCCEILKLTESCGDIVS
ncbi:hypothetical protein CHARACLAT_031405, partial [Characodon lateralis]|nr:hypothetical protein [Characodon lateralis]